eukprot:GHVQ01015416.1.p1 GENE.GHVQ01015416.1~~GHVQ01015416.1.p1  ORF type:complete len:570 (-),score=101.92 GHVQ01015416.1:455-1945(-)
MFYASSRRHGSAARDGNGFGRDGTSSSDLEDGRVSALCQMIPDDNSADCFLLEWAAAIGRSWGSENEDLKVAADAISNILKPLNGVSAAAKFVCESADTYVQMLGLPSSNLDADEIISNAMGHCYPDMNSQPFGIQEADNEAKDDEELIKERDNVIKDNELIDEYEDSEEYVWSSSRMPSSRHLQPSVSLFPGQCSVIETRAKAACFLEEFAAIIGAAWDTEQFDRMLMQSMIAMLQASPFMESTTQFVCFHANQLTAIFQPPGVNLVGDTVAATALARCSAVRDEDSFPLPGIFPSRPQTISPFNPFLSQTAIENFYSSLMVPAFLLTGFVPPTGVSRQSLGGGLLGGGGILGDLLGVFPDALGGILGDADPATDAVTDDSGEEISSVDVPSAATTGPADVRSRSCAMLDTIDNRCFIIEYAGFVGRSWGTEEFDRELAEDLITMLEPIGAVAESARALCSTARASLGIIMSPQASVTEEDLEKFMSKAYHTCKA